MTFGFLVPLQLFHHVAFFSVCSTNLLGPFFVRTPQAIIKSSLWFNSYVCDIFYESCTVASRQCTNRISYLNILYFAKCGEISRLIEISLKWGFVSPYISVLFHSVSSVHNRTPSVDKAICP